MCCASDVTNETADLYNALPLNSASDRELLAGLTVDDDDEHDDPVLRDAAGKGGTSRRFTEHLTPRGATVVALVKPSARERTQWYFQRYAPHLPAAREIVMFDRSWYNRAGVERVMGFCTEEEYWEFMREAPEFERMLVRSGLDLTKFWFSVTPAEQRTRFIIRRIDPVRQWKLDPMDIGTLDKWEGSPEAKEALLRL